MSFRSSVPVRLSDQHPETGSIPGSSTEKVQVTTIRMPIGEARKRRSNSAPVTGEQDRLLCAHREGPRGVRHWNRQVEHWLTEDTGEPVWSP
jgi:ATP-dependent exoDNAse (exonuclease V) alpha subunit